MRTIRQTPNPDSELNEVMSHVAGTYLGISADRRPSDSSDSSSGTRPEATSQEPEASDGSWDWIYP